MSGLKFGAASMAGLAKMLQRQRENGEAQQAAQAKYRHLELLENLRQSARFEEAMAEAENREARHREQLGLRERDSLLKELLRQETLKHLARAKQGQWQGKWFSGQEPEARPEGFQGPPIEGASFVPDQDAGRFRQAVGEEWADSAEEALARGDDPAKVRLDLEKESKERWRQKQRLVDHQEKLQATTEAIQERRSGPEESELPPLSAVLKQGEAGLPPPLPLLEVKPGNKMVRRKNRLVKRKAKLLYGGGQ